MRLIKSEAYTGYLFFSGFRFGFSIYGVVRLVQVTLDVSGMRDFSFCIFVCQINRYDVPIFAEGGPVKTAKRFWLFPQCKSCLNSL